jgi:hypothetical protein
MVVYALIPLIGEYYKIYPKKGTAKYARYIIGLNEISQ